MSSKVRHLGRKQPRQRFAVRTFILKTKTKKTKKQVHPLHLILTYHPGLSSVLRKWGTEYYDTINCSALAGCAAKCCNRARDWTSGCFLPNTMFLDNSTPCVKCVESQHYIMRKSKENCTSGSCDVLNSTSFQSVLNSARCYSLMDCATP